jgi:hypothetical protein
MLSSYIVSFISLAIALAAVWVSTWQVRQSSRATERSNALPVISELFREFRSSQFRDAVTYLLTSKPTTIGSSGFSSLPIEWRDRAYRVCYFFDYLGVLVTYNIITEDLVIGALGTRLVQVWQAIKPFIDMERQHRASSYPPGVPPGFLAYYEHLVQRTYELGGHEAAKRIHKRRGLRRTDMKM